MNPFLTSYKQSFRRLFISRPKLLNFLYCIKQLDFEACLETKTPTIVLFGNSLVRLGNWTKSLGRNDVINRGLASDSLQDMCERLKWLKSSSVKIAFIEGGINDLPTMQLDSLLSLYKQIISFWWTRGTIPVVHAILFIAPQAEKLYPWRADWQAINQQAVVLNKKLSEFCLINKIDFIDLNTTLSDDIQLRTEFTIDGVHLTPAAYKIWAQAITHVLEKHGL